jgi:hypothetical protein
MASGARSTDDGAGAFAGAEALEVALSVRPDGAPATKAKAGVIPANAGNDTVLAVLGTTTTEVAELVELAAGASGEGPLPPDAHPATMVPASSNPARTTRRRSSTRPAFHENEVSVVFIRVANQALASEGRRSRA